MRTKHTHNTASCLRGVRIHSLSHTVSCECGVVIKGRDDDELVRQAQRHAREAHRIQITREQVLAMVRPE